MPRRPITAILAAAAALLVTAGTAQASNPPVCEAAPILLQGVTIVDASGQWDNQDIYIENGRISAVGSRIDLEEAAVPVLALGRPGAVVRPAAQPAASDGEAIFIRATARPSSAARERMPILTAGSPADLTVYRAGAGASGLIDLEIRGGRIVGETGQCVG